MLRAPGCSLWRLCTGVCPRNRHVLRSEHPCTPACPPRGTPVPASPDRPRLCLPRPLQTPALRCVFALAIVGLVLLLLQPEGALGEELQVPQPRAASWLNLGSFKKYIGKLFNSRWAGGGREVGRKAGGGGVGGARRGGGGAEGGTRTPPGTPTHIAARAGLGEQPHDCKDLFPARRNLKTTRKLRTPRTPPHRKARNTLHGPPRTPSG